MRWILLVAALLLGLPTSAQMTLIGAGGGSGCTALSPPSGGFYDTTNFSGWSTTGSSLTTSDAPSLDCTNDASTITEDTSTGTHIIYEYSISHTVTATSVTDTVYAQEGSGTRDLVVTQFNSGFSANTQAGIDLENCTTVFSSTSYAAATVMVTLTSESGGWCKIVMKTSTVTDTSFNMQMVMYNGSSSSYVGNGTSSIVLWGFGMTSP